MQKNTEKNPPDGPTSPQVIVLILLWLFILVWMAPLASLAAPGADSPVPGEDRDSPFAPTR